MSSVAEDRRFRLSESQALEISQKFGTPAYVIDEKNFRDHIRAYRSAFSKAYANSEITFATKSNSCLALIKIADLEGCKIDVASQGELRAALTAGVPANRCHFHGNNKSYEELKFAHSVGVEYIIADHFLELEMLASILEGERTKVVLRLAPGVDPRTHAKISTGQADTKFGFNIADGSAEAATVRCLELGLPLIGFHCHVGSQLLDPEAQISGGELIATFARQMLEKHLFRAEYLNIGGGLGVVYVSGDQPMPVQDYCGHVVRAIERTLEGSGLAPKLAQEPGRSLVAESGVTLYQVGVIKTVPSSESTRRTFVAVNGGLSDNPRPALYGSKYTVLKAASAKLDFPHGGTSKSPSLHPPVKNEDGTITVTVSGRHCETDRLFDDVNLPGDLKEGDLIQVLSTGAYNSSMSSNYNRFSRPRTVLIRLNGELNEIQREDSWEEMFARETVPADL